MHLDVADGTVVADTAAMQAVTPRTAAAIRILCRDLRHPAGYELSSCLARLDAHPHDPPVVTAAEAHQYLGIPPNRIYQWVHRRRLTPVDRVGRHPRYSVADLIELDRRPADHPGGLPPRSSPT